VKFGIFYSHQLPRPWPDGAERALFANALEQAAIADGCGVDYAWAQEHHFLEEYAHSSAPEVFLGALSQRTHSMRIGHGIALMPPAYNHPARVAERIATLDLVSGGRAEWGTGESGTRIELEAFGIPYLDKRPMWEEAVRETARMLCSEPYRGYQGRFFAMPPRNLVPKPIQRPHPPLWMACSNRESMRYAARRGVGALTFAFMDPSEARYWVREYYEVFERECDPIGRDVNPNVAMLAQFMCLEDPDRARREGLAGSRFFAFGLSHYYRDGVHVPGRTRIWDAFARAPEFHHAGNTGIGSPAEVSEAFRRFEDAGVDQLILLHQAGNYRHDAVCESLALFGREVLPAFRERDELAREERAARLRPGVDRARSRIAPLEPPDELPEVECFPRLAERYGAEVSRLVSSRNPLPGSLWKLQVAGPRRGRRGGAAI
jgi:alkanesulfonate monooxygenase SsuD/methylene tetrahydromethanopterin reductase-like flavin-dependent oxidoreductase (luciferase family)